MKSSKRTPIRLLNTAQENKKEVKIVAYSALLYLAGKAQQAGGSAGRQAE
jgi:hypothetical protein